jgi:hypothetical protein
VTPHIRQNLKNLSGRVFWGQKKLFDEKPETKKSRDAVPSITEKITSDTGGHLHKENTYQTL